ncbi:MAG: hypothetical protein A3G34_12875 [Candidatus Lindowbacteria bacterium RIFCSPLOWO2_12_FULL_62_27]|nr:MAG: hypothetical protein A3I06_15180 [Candidatus Lindowbacteria bacterium RIFCSPLOWO2_02_FULL_62_12]OGH62486.1 MAG: hypothetical protein A3G34_12875 [Candidatus Lindowbacteria bacterium RIFCSPLOWO2_12_FULL_62_27]
MAELIELKTFSDKRGNLSVIEQPQIPFEIKRIFYIYGVDGSTRGGHRHRRTRQALICLQGGCVVENDDGRRYETFVLDRPNQCLILEPPDWHLLREFSPGAILLVLASELFDERDYIHDKYAPRGGDQ